MNEQRKGQLEGWFILELFGHQRIAGNVSEVTLGTNVMLRVDVPEIKYQEFDYSGVRPKPIDKSIPAFTKFYNPSAVYAATPVTEETAKTVMQSFRARPVQEFEIRAALPAPSESQGQINDGDEGRDEELDPYRRSDGDES